MAMGIGPKASRTSRDMVLIQDVYVPDHFVHLQTTGHLALASVATAPSAFSGKRCVDIREWAIVPVAPSFVVAPMG